MSLKVVTGEVRFSYVHVFEPYAFESEDPKYSVMLLVPKSDTKTLNALREAEKAAKEKGKSTVWGGRIPSVVSSILKDGDEVAQDYPERQGHYFLTVRSNTKPQVVDTSLNAIIDPTEVYSGCYGRVSINAFPYKFGGSSGVSFGLNNVQKLKDGEPLGGMTRAEDDFSDSVDDADFADDLI